MNEVALEDWTRALWEQLQDCPNNETAWEIISENGRKLITEAEAERDQWWKDRGHSDDC